MDPHQTTTGTPRGVLISHTDPLRDPRFGAFPLSLGRDAVEAHGLKGNRKVVFVHNYTSAEVDRESGQYFPPNLTPTPATDYEVAFVAAITAQPGEIGLTLPLQEGMEQYYRARGILTRGAELLEVNPQLDSSRPEALGWPYTDILRNLVEEEREFRGRPFFVASLPTCHVNGLAAASGAEPVQLSLAHQTNNKARFQEDAKRFDYAAIAGWVVRNDRELEAVANQIRDVARVWVKHSNSAGGDGVVRVDAPITPEKLKEAMRIFRRHEEETIIRTGFSRDAVHQISRDVVVQLDATIDPCTLVQSRRLKTIGGALFRVSYDGQVTLHSCHTQHTAPDGTFLGSTPWQPTPKELSLIVHQVKKVGRYCAEDLKLFGNVGIDLVVVEDHEGTPHVELIELNGRPNATTLSRIIAEKLAAPYWVQVSANYRAPLTSFRDLVEALGEEVLFERAAGPQIVPLCLRTLTRINDEGGRDVLYPSAACKLLVVGRSQAQVDEGTSYLMGRGFSFKQ